jgi:hypothetical protein
VRKQMENYFGKPSEVGKNIKKATKNKVNEMKNSPQAKAVGKAVKSPSVQTAAGLLIPGGVALKAPKIAKAVQSAGKAIKKAVGAGKPKSLAKSYDPSIPFKPDYKPPSARAPVSQRTQQPLKPLTKEEKAFAQRYQFETAPGKVRDMRAQQAKQAQEDYKKKMAKEAEAKKQAEKDRRMKSEVEAYESSQRRNKSIPITSYYHYFD